MGIAKPSGTGAKAINILIVEDNSTDAELVAGILDTHQPTSEEYIYSFADSLAKATKMLEELRFDVILLDLFLPDSEGLETVKKIWARTRNTPIVVLSGTADKDVAIQAVREGAQDYLTKGKDDLSELPWVMRKAVERERLKNALRLTKIEADDATKLKDKFVSLVMHELTTPIAVMQGILGVVLDDRVNPLHSQHQKLIEKVLNNANEMLSMTNELLSMSKISSGTIRAEKRFVDMKAITDRAISRYEGMAMRKKITIKDEVAQDTGVYTDPQLLEVVVKNLLSNAIKYCKEGDHILIFSPKGKNSSLAVQDSGVGINEKDLPDLFEEKVGLTKPGTIGEVGAGVGLPFSAKIISALGGKLEAKSVIGKGSVFYTLLPDVKPKILIVDDDEMTRELCKSALESMDAEIEEASDGESAVAKIKKENFHLITIDITMPGMSGFDLLKLLRSHKRTMDIPVMMLTSDKSVETRKKAFNMGANDFASKPIKKEEYFPRIAHLLSGDLSLEEDILSLDI